MLNFKPDVTARKVPTQNSSAKIELTKNKLLIILFRVGLAQTQKCWFYLRHSAFKELRVFRVNNFVDHGCVYGNRALATFISILLLHTTSIHKRSLEVTDTFTTYYTTFYYTRSSPNFWGCSWLYQKVNRDFIIAHTLTLCTLCNHLFFFRTNSKNRTEIVWTVSLFYKHLFK